MKNFVEKKLLALHFRRIKKLDTEKFLAMFEKQSAYFGKYNDYTELCKNYGVDIYKNKKDDYHIAVCNYKFCYGLHKKFEGCIAYKNTLYMKVKISGKEYLIHPNGKDCKDFGGEKDNIKGIHSFEDFTVMLALSNNQWSLFYPDGKICDKWIRHQYKPIRLWDIIHFANKKYALTSTPSNSVFMLHTQNGDILGEYIRETPLQPTKFSSVCKKFAKVLIIRKSKKIVVMDSEGGSYRLNTKNIPEQYYMGKREVYFICSSSIDPNYKSMVCESSGEAFISNCDEIIHYHVFQEKEYIHCCSNGTSFLVAKNGDISFRAKYEKAIGILQLEFGNGIKKQFLKIKKLGINMFIDEQAKIYRDLQKPVLEYEIAILLKKVPSVYKNELNALLQHIHDNTVSEEETIFLQAIGAYLKEFGKNAYPELQNYFRKCICDMLTNLMNG